MSLFYLEHTTASASSPCFKVEEYLDCFQVEMAVKFCERALKLEPDNLEVIDTLAPLLLEAGDGDRAFEVSSPRSM